MTSGERSPWGNAAPGCRFPYTTRPEIVTHGACLESKHRKPGRNTPELVKNFREAQYV